MESQGLELWRPGVRASCAHPLHLGWGRVRSQDAGQRLPAPAVPYLAAGLSQPSTANHGCWGLKYCLVCLEVTRGISQQLLVMLGTVSLTQQLVQKESRDVRTPESTSTELPLSIAGERVRRKWEHQYGEEIGRRRHGPEDVFGQTVRTWGGWHTFPLPFNKQGTKYLVLWEQSEVKQVFMLKYMHPTTSTLLSNDNKINNATRLTSVPDEPGLGNN